MMIRRSFFAALLAPLAIPFAKLLPKPVIGKSATSEIDAFGLSFDEWVRLNEIAALKEAMSLRPEYIRVTPNQWAHLRTIPYFCQYEPGSGTQGEDGEIQGENSKMRRIRVYKI